MALPLALIGMIPSIINLFTGETSRTDSVIDLAKKAGEALGMENATPEDVLKHIEQNPDAAQIVEQVNEGNQTVPTLVFADGYAMTNPSLQAVLSKLDELESARN